MPEATNEQIVLFAKDRLVKHYGCSLLRWNIESWNIILKQLIMSFTDEDLDRIGVEFTTGKYSK